MNDPDILSDNEELRTLKILLIEDDEEDYLITRDILSDIENVRVELEWLPDYDAGVRALQDNEYDVCLLDYRLGARDGLDLLRHVCQDGCRVPFILLTGQESHEVDVAASAAGAMDYLVKSYIHAPLLERSIRYAIERKRAQEALLHAHSELEARVLERTSELAKTNEALQVEAAERQSAMRALREAKDESERSREEAERANQAKSEFLSRMSHELRTPLNAILGFGQVLDRQDLTPRDKNSVGYILQGGRHLLDLINEVLDIARVEAGNLDFSPEPVALNDVVPEVCALVQPLADERNIRLDNDTCQLSQHYILADLQRLKQVLLNLLSNAIKYNREDGKVEVSCGPQREGFISIAVRDTGPGISPQDLPKLFTPFERLSAAASGVEGSGLGLVLSQSLVTAMGGTLTVQSTLGLGTTFTLELPQASAPEEQATNIPQVSHPVDTDGKIERTYCVLCIEDNPSNLRLMEALFEKRPEITLMAAMQGSIGLDLARQHEPDLILLDLDLPDIHGSEVLTRLQQSALTRDIPVVVVSADATPKQIERLLTAGAKSYLTKPLNVRQFLDTVDECLQ